MNVIQLGPDETVTSLITLNDKRKEGMKYFFMGTRLGVVKKTEIEAYKNVRSSGIIAIRLRDNDELGWVRLSSGNDSIMMATKQGQAIRFREEDVRPMGRSASGVRGIKLRAGDEVMAMDVLVEQTDILIVTERGFGKRVNVTHFGEQNRGGIGLRAAKVTAKTGPVVGAVLVREDDAEVVMISERGQTIRIALSSFKRLGRDTQGVTVMRFREDGDKIASLAVLTKQEEVEDVADDKVQKSVKA